MLVYKLDGEGGKQEFVGRASGAQMVWAKLGMDTPTLRGKWVKCNEMNLGDEMNYEIQ